MIIYIFAKKGGAKPIVWGAKPIVIYDYINLSKKSRGLRPSIL
jgi:hypothetical protein